MKNLVDYPRKQKEHEALAKERKSILIVEDCLDTRQMIKYALRHAGFKSVLEAADGVEGLKIMQRQPIALVITDWRMPNMDGLAFVQNATSKSRRKIPFLMLTSEGSKDNVVEAIEAGVSDYILKPFNLNLLAGKVSKLLEG